MSADDKCSGCKHKQHDAACGYRWPAWGLASCVCPGERWRCICGSGDNGEWHSLMCAASNTPDEVWYADTDS